MTELAPELPALPSIRAYAAEHGLEAMPHGVQLREHAVALSGYRAALAQHKGLTEDELHRGVFKPITEANINQSQPSEAA